ncbi:MAG: U32 family peptidase [Bdellovibrio sp.]|nr:U32 family peptidase [Bdellovibrio sp.]
MSTTNIKPELLAPAGSFEAAYYAFLAGADAVYLGLSDFSARKAARNFSLEELRVLRRFATDNGKRILVTANTVIKETEREDLAEMLFDLESIGVDGVIIQDLGLLEMIRRHFPRIPIHASTQMAVQDTLGLQHLAGLGVKRVVLPRELTLNEITRLRKENPNIELEVFIHGALCYSVSGMCLISGTQLGRSANRGECAQLCRSTYQRAGSTGHYFSCNDLALTDEVLKLASLGINSLKIEGRMKPPEYVQAVVTLYRRILDQGTPLPAKEMEQLEKNISLTFSRGTTKAFFNHSSGMNLLSNEYASHRGIPLGKVRESWRDGFSLTLEHAVAAHDGLMFFRKTEPPEPVRFALKNLVVVAGGNRIPGFYARAGQMIEVDCPTPPPVGTDLFLISSRDLDLKAVKSTSFPSHVMELAMEAKLVAGELSLTTVIAGRTFSKAYPVQVEIARVPRDFCAILSDLFSQSGEHPFQINAVSLTTENNQARDTIFIPPSKLKSIKNDFYSELGKQFLAQRQAVSLNALELPKVEAVYPWPQNLSMPIARQTLSPRGPLPFVPCIPDELDSLARLGDFYVVPLRPVVIDDEKYYRSLEKLIQAHPGKQFLIGLNNLGQVAFSGDLAKRHPNTFFFLDFFCYIANTAAAFFYFSTVPPLLFAFSWIEGDVPALKQLMGRVFTVGDGFKPPLFVSRVCIHRHTLGECPTNCSRHLCLPMTSGRRKGQAVIEDCMTYFFLSE